MSQERLGGVQFETTQLEPIGELWEAGDSVDMDALLRDAPDELVQAVEEKALVVLDRTKPTKNGEGRYPDPTGFSNVGHIDALLPNRVRVQLLQSTGFRQPTGYMTNAALTQSARARIGDLRTIVDKAPTELVDRFLLRDNMHYLEDPAVDAAFIMTGNHEPLTAIYRRLAHIENIFPGVRIEPGLESSIMYLGGLHGFTDQDKARLRQEYTDLTSLYRRLMGFCQAVTANAQRYVHDWNGYSSSTVLARQDTQLSFDPESLGRKIFHAREQVRLVDEHGEPINYPPEQPLMRNFIIQNDDRGGRCRVAFPSRSDMW